MEGWQRKREITLLHPVIHPSLPLISPPLFTFLSISHSSAAPVKCRGCEIEGKMERQRDGGKRGWTGGMGGGE